MSSCLLVRPIKGDHQAVPLLCSEDTPIKNLKQQLGYLYNVPPQHQKLVYNKKRICKDEDVLLKRFKFKYGSSADGASANASCIFLESMFPLKDYQEGGQAYPYVKNGKVFESRVHGTDETFSEKYIRAAQSTFSVRAIMWMWNKNYMTRLVLVTCVMFLFVSFFVPQPEPSLLNPMASNEL
jgi:hypothetical protein